MAQDPASSDQNPLAQIHEVIKSVLDAEMLSFSEEQERAIILMMEERRKASEELFGDLNDFRSGPTQGQESERLQSAIAWLRGEFLMLLEEYLTPEQLQAWSRFESTRVDEGESPAGSEPAAAPVQQTQYVRINN